MDLLDEEILTLFKALNGNEVRYIMVGGFATNLHGFSRTTADIDVWLKDERENRIRFQNALKQLDLGDHDYIVNGPIITGWTTINLSSGFELDVMVDLKGVEKNDFDLIFENSPTAIIENIPVKFLHINQLIKTKEAVNRPKDQIDLIELYRIRDEREK